MLASSDRNQEFRIVLCKTAKSDSFGFSVFGGLGSALPVVVSEIKENSIADQCGQLEVGDILVEANGLRLLENVLSTLEVSRYLQAQPTLTLELKIRKDPVVRCKTHDILRDPEDFDKISSAVSPDNLHALRRLTIQSTHTHQLVEKQRGEDLGYGNKQRTFQSASNLHVRTTSHASNLSDDDYSSTCSVKEDERKQQRLDWSTNNCYPGYATIRRTPTKKKEDKDSIAKSMPTNVDLIGKQSTIKLSQPAEKEEQLFNDAFLTGGGSLPRSPRAVSDYKSFKLYDTFSGAAAETGAAAAGPKCAKRFLSPHEVNLPPPRRSQKDTDLLLSDANGDGGRVRSGSNDLMGTQFFKDQTHKRSLSPEIKEAIACADPSSCWADYFPESISFISSSNQNSSRSSTTVVQTTTTHSSPVQKYSVLTPPSNNSSSNNNSSSTNSEQTLQSVPTSLMNETISTSCPTPNQTNPPPIKTVASKDNDYKDNSNSSSINLHPITPPPQPPFTHQKSVVTTTAAATADSLNDEEISPYQHTQHFNSPVLGASERSLFFNCDHPHSSQQFHTSSVGVVKPASLQFSSSTAVDSSLSSEQIQSTCNTSDGCYNSTSDVGPPQSLGSVFSAAVAHAPVSANFSTPNHTAALPEKQFVRSNCVRRDSFEKENGEMDDEDDSPASQCYILKSLEIAAPPPAKATPEVDVAAAKRLATRLFYLNGFDRSDVPKHLGKKQDFSQAVAMEYFKFYDFTAERIDVSLRKFFLNLFLCGDTQERERILSHFSRRYFDCNPTLFPSFESVDYLVTAIVLLNQDLNTIQAGSRTSMGVRPMTAQQFVTNVITKPQPLHILHCNPSQPPEEYSEYSRELLTDLYYSIRDEPLLCAVCPLPPPTTSSMPSSVAGVGASTDASILVYSQDPGMPLDNSINQFHPKFPASVDASIFSQQAQFNMAAAAASFTARLPTCSGYLNRKWLFEADLKKTGKLKRSWKHWYVKLQGLDLIHHKSREDAQKSSGGEQKAVILSLHHCLALPVNGTTTANAVDDFKELSQSDLSEDASEDTCSSVNSNASSSKSEKSTTKRLSSKSSSGGGGGGGSSSSSSSHSKWDFTLRTADWAQYQFRCRGKQEMNEWIGAINLVAAHSSPPLMAPIANNPNASSAATDSREKKSNKGGGGGTNNTTANANGPSSSPAASAPSSFQKHFKPAAFSNLKIQDQIAVWGDWVTKSEIEHAEAMRRHANLPSSTSKSVVQAIEQQILYCEFEVQRYQCYQEALIENLNNARSSLFSAAEGAPLMTGGAPTDIYGAPVLHSSFHMTHPSALVHQQKTTTSQSSSSFSIDECSSSDMSPNSACVQYPPNMQSAAAALDTINQQTPTPTPEFLNVAPPDIPTAAQIPRLFPKKPSPTALSHSAVDYGVL